MALSLVRSFTYAPNATIASNENNTNENTLYNAFSGLEAGTSSMSKLPLDADPTNALYAATKQYVDHYSTWKRPVLTFSSASTIAVESGQNGTSGNIPILFPDGSIRTETSTTRTTFDITRNAVLVTSGAQSGLRTSLSETANTWYSLYAVKVTDSSTLWCTVGDTVLPIQANYSTLNSNFGTSGWVYLGTVRNGDNVSATTDLLSFRMVGHKTVFRNLVASSALGSCTGVRLANSASATSLVYGYSAGTGSTNIPNHMMMGTWMAVVNPGVATNIEFRSNDVNDTFYIIQSAAGFWGARSNDVNLTDGIQVTIGSASPCGITLAGFVDNVLGVGSNPLL